MDHEISSVDELEALIGRPGAAAVRKQRPRLHDLDRQWLAASRFCLLATADGQGRCVL
jgi:predicted pyridoxine 5'-phosphate oxidase superfamily flavin-nucleotide-binding protein